MFRERQQQDAYAPFKMGVQSYSMRKMGLEAMLRATRELGLRYIEAFMAHLPYFTAPDKWGELRQTVAKSGVEVLAYGVVSFGADEKPSRTIFEFAHAMGIPVITADPAPESFRYLPRLCEEFKIRVAIHNHGPGTRYDTIRSVEEALRGQPESIGACIDTAHFLRSGEDPVEAARRFGKRVHAVHLKDVKERTRYTLLGQGDLNMVEFLRVLRRIEFQGCLALEYEENADNPLPDLRACLEAVRTALRRV
ncbi:MAG: sugar phosphate isomerase/epimerase [Fimbriimonadales bacterium]|nr:sugar phosphate isomerase/epimerase [Fimbriimonadales bacterium]